MHSDLLHSPLQPGGCSARLVSGVKKVHSSKQDVYLVEESCRVLILFYTEHLMVIFAEVLQCGCNDYNKAHCPAGAGTAKRLVSSPAAPTDY